MERRGGVLISHMPMNSLLMFSEPGDAPIAHLSGPPFPDHVPRVSCVIQWKSRSLASNGLYL